MICNNYANTYYDDASEAILGEFYRRNFDVILFDYRGTGQSEGSRFSSTTLVEDCESVCAYARARLALKDSDMILYGHCLGGAVAIHTAKQHPDMMLIVDRTFKSWHSVIERHLSYRWKFLGRWISRHCKFSKIRFDNEQALRDLKNKTTIIIFGTQDIYLGSAANGIALAGNYKTSLSHSTLLPDEILDDICRLVNLF